MNEYENTAVQALGIQLCYTTKHYLNVAFSCGSVISFKGLTTHKSSGVQRPKNNLLWIEGVFSKPVQKTPIPRLWHHYKNDSEMWYRCRGKKLKCLNVILEIFSTSSYRCSYRFIIQVLTTNKSYSTQQKLQSGFKLWTSTSVASMRRTLYQVSYLSASS